MSFTLTMRCFSKLFVALLLLLSAACANIIGQPPDQTQAPSYTQTQAGAATLVDDEEQLRKELISLRKKDQAAQAQRIEEAALPKKSTPVAGAQTDTVTAIKQQQPMQEQLWIRVPFKSGYTSVARKMRKALTDVAGKFLAEPRRQSLVVRGFCDAEPIGGYDGKHQSHHRFKTQLALSQKRAQTVADVLIKAGIHRDLIQVEGYGANYFIADNDTVAGRNKNRRVDVFLLNY